MFHCSFISEPPRPVNIQDTVYRVTRGSLYVQLPTVDVSFKSCMLWKSEVLKYVLYLSPHLWLLYPPVNWWKLVFNICLHVLPVFLVTKAVIPAEITRQEKWIDIDRPSRQKQHPLVCYHQNPILTPNQRCPKLVHCLFRGKRNQDDVILFQLLQMSNIW